MATVECHTCGKTVNVYDTFGEGDEIYCIKCAHVTGAGMLNDTTSGLQFPQPQPLLGEAMPPLPPKQMAQPQQIGQTQQAGQPSSQAIQKVMTENKSEIVKRTSTVHSEDTTSDIARALHIPVNVLILARILHTKVINHPLWDCRRSPHALFVDCIYIVSKHKKMKMTSRNIAQTTKDYFGVGTQPRPNEWCIEYAFIVDEVLD